MASTNDAPNEYSRAPQYQRPVGDVGAEAARVVAVPTLPVPPEPSESGAYPFVTRR